MAGNNQAFPIVSWFISRSNTYPSLVRWYRLGQMSISSSTVPSVLGCYPCKGKADFPERLLKLSRGSFLWNLKDKQDIVDPIFLSCSSIFQNIKWVTEQHCRVGWVPSTTSHLGRLGCTPSPNWLNTNCQGEAVQSGQNHPAPITHKNLAKNYPR